MNIYIYGNHSFKKEIHETLEHSNIKFKLDDNSIIKEIDDLSELKKTIKKNPKDIYLIDDEKIIKKNSLNTKIKFFAPKDGIEEEFLLDSGIADLSINSLSEIPKYILRKHDEEKLQHDSNIQDSIVNIVDEAYEKEAKENVELDDELSKLLAKEEISADPKNSFEEENVDLNDLFNMHSDINLGDSEDIIGDNEESQNISKEELDDIMNFNDNFGLNNISFDYDDKDTEDEFSKREELDEDSQFDDTEIFEDIDFLGDIFSEKPKKIEKEDKRESLDEYETLNESLQGEMSMNDDKFFELDSLNEDDLLDALNCTDNKKNNKQDASSKNDLVEKNSNSINITNSSNTDELAQLISKLLSNKTLEITIKIKD